MDWIEIFGYAAAILIGISLGLIGGGGSILTVPAMTYLFALDSVSATAYSLFVVGTASLVGSINYMKKGLVNYKTALVFGLPAIAGVYVTRKFIVPQIPEIIYQGSAFTLTRDMLIMGIFAVLMLAASYSMLKPKGPQEDLEQFRPQKFNYPLILLEGLVVGALTGLVGAGGGFLIIPALVVLSKLPMKMAVGTSLLIIAVKSLIGFTGDLSNPELTINWPFLLIFTAITVLGIFIGSKLSDIIPGKKLKPGFGVFIVVMGAYILIKEFYLS
jgi:uncharacterized membrane protein YfcA